MMSVERRCVRMRATEGKKACLQRRAALLADVLSVHYAHECTTKSEAEKYNDLRI